MSAASSTKKTSIDRLSALPDCLLIHILSLLEVKEASITSLLSKRWQFLRTELPRLVFRERRIEIKEINKFVARVHRTLLICSRNNFESLEIEFWYADYFACDVNAWIEFAVRNKLKEFHLLLKGSRRDFHTPPQIMYTNSSLTSLSVVGTAVAPRRAIEWHSLTELRIERIVLSQIVVEKILSGCPVLRSLCIVGCWGFNCLEIKSPSVCTLCVSAIEDPLEISAPYVRYLAICHTGKRELRLRNVESVVRANIALRVSEWDAISKMVIRNVNEVFVKTQHVKELEVQSRLFQVMSKLVVNGWQLPQSTRERLKVFVYTDDDNYMHITSGFVALLESSPNIHTLTIDLDINATDKDNWVTSGRDDLDRDLLHLKTVKFKYSCAIPSVTGDQMLAWACILLKRATVLEEMVIETDLEDASDFVKISQTLLNYPRSSKKAVVLLREL